MKKQIPILAAAVFSLTLFSAIGQGMRGGMGGMGAALPGPSFGGGIAKILGENSGFSANLEMHASGGANGSDIIMPGKLAYLDGKSRFEFDMTEAKGIPIKPQDAARMKQMGMGNMIHISRPDKKVKWVVYPGLQAYMENPLQEADAATTAADYTIQETDQGTETVDGHDCVKKKVVVTGKDGKSHESMVWSATDLKKFPIKIESEDGGSKSTLLFKEVKLEKPDAAQFEVSADFTKYNDMMQMMMQQMMKQRGGMRGMPGQ